MRYLEKTSKKVIATALIACMFSAIGGGLLSDADTASQMEVVGDSVKSSTNYRRESKNISMKSSVSLYATGFYKMGNRWIYLENGMQKNGWITYKGVNYYIRDDYSLPQSTFEKIDGYYYYFDRNGIMVKNQKVKLGGEIYQFDSNGRSIKPDRKTDFRVTSEQEKLYNLGEDILDAAKDKYDRGITYNTVISNGYAKKSTDANVNINNLGNANADKNQKNDVKRDKKTESNKNETNKTETNKNSNNIDSKSASKVISSAQSKIGSPYVWGATGPSSFDCSGLMQYAFSSAGVSLPRVSADQAKVGSYVSRSDLKPGDMVFWGEPVHHVGLYVGNGEYIHAPYPGTSVEKAKLGEYTTARRVLK